MVSLREVEPKILRMAIWVKYFMVKRQNGECNARNLDGFLRYEI